MIARTRARTLRLPVPVAQTRASSVSSPNDAIRHWQICTPEPSARPPCSRVVRQIKSGALSARRTIGAARPRAAGPGGDEVARSNEEQQSPEKRPRVVLAVRAHHGDGEYRYTDGSVYNGGWIAGFRHGHGVMRFQDGSIYNVSDFTKSIHY